MKNLFLSFCVLVSTSSLYGQVVCAGVTPASIAGNYNFSWSDPANGWSSPDFNIPGTSVSGELVLVDDGSVGNSPASGLPLANYGCATLVNSVAGKIAVVYRYDGVTASTICWMSDKAKFAQDAGAIAVVVVNRPGANEDLGNGGGTAASTVTIPVVLISFNDGATLRAEMLNGPVTMFLGNKTGLFANDIGIVGDSSLIAKNSSIPPGLAQNGTAFNFELGTRVYNYGTNNQTAVTVTATVLNPSGATVYTNTVGPLSIPSGGSADIYPGTSQSFPTFSLASYPIGKYTLTYSVSTGGVDGYPGDNQSESVFYVKENLFAYSKLDPVTQLPTASAGYRPSTNNSTFSTCLVIEHPNASNLIAEGMYFSASTAYGSGVSLTGEEMALNLYAWNDVFTDLNDANLAFNSLAPVAFGYYYYPSDLQNETVYGAFDAAIQLSNNQRYLACVQTTNTNIYLGHDVKSDYTWNIGYYLQPLGPNESDGVYYAIGFGEDKMPAIGLEVCDWTINTICVGGLMENNLLEGKAFPNPSNDQVTISVKANGHAELTITDISGKVVSISSIHLDAGNAPVDLSELENGIYLFSVLLEDGRMSQFNVVKN
jgi:hypothetical protein